MHLHIDNASLVFPKTHCFLVQLTVWKRNIVNCGSPMYRNHMHYSFTVACGGIRVGWGCPTPRTWLTVRRRLADRCSWWTRLSTHPARTRRFPHSTGR